MMHTTTNGRTTKTYREPPSIAGRPPPHDLDAEAAVLSSVLLKRGAIDDVADLKPEHFFSEANSRIFETCLHLAATGVPIDTVTVASELRDRERLQQVGGAAYLAQIVDATPAVAHVADHAAIVTRKWRRRRAISTAQLIAAEGYGDLDEEGEDAWLDGLASRLAEDDVHQEGEAVHIGDAFRRVWGERTAAQQQARAQLGAPTGLVDLDRRIGGLRPGKITTVAARAGVGKTALAFQVVTNVVKQGDAALVFELEAPEEECVDRLHYATAGVDGSRLLANQALPPEDMRALSGAAEQLVRTPLWVLPRSGVTVSSIRTTTRRLKRFLDVRADAAIAEAKSRGVPAADLPTPPRLRVVVVDYIQLVAATDMRGGASASREAQVSYVSRELKRLAMDLRVHVMLLSQLNKDADRRGDDKRPRTSDMRESSAIENDSDHIILIHNAKALERSREDVDSEPEPFDDVELILGKNRGGRPGTIRVHWVPAQQLYRCIERTDRRPWSTP